MWTWRIITTKKARLQSIDKKQNGLTLEPIQTQKEITTDNHMQMLNEKQKNLDTVAKGWEPRNAFLYSLVEEAREKNIRQRIGKLLCDVLKTRQRH